MRKLKTLQSEYSNQFSKTESLNMYFKTCVNREFELELKRVFDTGVIKMPIYLSLGEEHIPAAISEIMPHPLIFRQHRGHSTYLSFGGEINELVREMLLLKEGSATGGRGGSSHLSSKKINMFGHCGLVGHQIPIAVGAAFASGNPTLAIMGDASVEEDYVLSVFGFAAMNKVPVLFICEDNDLSILTKTEIRRHWNAKKVVKSFEIPSYDIDDDPWSIMYHVKKCITDGLPGFINIRTCREYWHSGTGVDGPMEWDRFGLMKQEMIRLDIAEDALHAEMTAKDFVQEAWSLVLENVNSSTNI